MALPATAPVKKDYTGMSFAKAFSAARKEAGNASGTFTWNGKEYGTMMADEAIKLGQKQWIYSENKPTSGSVEQKVNKITPQKTGTSSSNGILTTGQIAKAASTGLIPANIPDVDRQTILKLNPNARDTTYEGFTNAKVKSVPSAASAQTNKILSELRTQIEKSGNDEKFFATYLNKAIKMGVEPVLIYKTLDYYRKAYPNQLIAKKVDTILKKTGMDALAKNLTPKAPKMWKNVKGNYLEDIPGFTKGPNNKTTTTTNQYGKPTTKTYQKTGQGVYEVSTNDIVPTKFGKFVKALPSVAKGAGTALLINDVLTNARDNKDQGKMAFVNSLIENAVNVAMSPFDLINLATGNESMYERYLREKWEFANYNPNWKKLGWKDPYTKGSNGRNSVYEGSKGTSRKPLTYVNQLGQTVMNK